MERKLFLLPFAGAECTGDDQGKSTYPDKKLVAFGPIFKAEMAQKFVQIVS